MKFCKSLRGTAVKAQGDLRDLMGAWRASGIPSFRMAQADGPISFARIVPGRCVGGPDMGRQLGFHFLHQPGIISSAIW
jgi:hypothetical protein